MTVASLAALVLTATCAADEVPGAAAKQREPKEREQRQARFLDEMRTLALATNVRYQQGERAPKLVDSPVFRYDDQPRRFLDATLWVWTDKGRPVAFQKVEAMPYQWQYCFTSLADDLLEVEWSSNHRYRTTERGVAFRPLPDAPDVPARSAKRLMELRKLAREFSARISFDHEANSTEEMRLLSTPIFEYSDPQLNLLTGAVFGFATNGTNPDLLVVLEARKQPNQQTPSWHYGAARMTTGGVTLKHRETTVAEFGYVDTRTTGFATWTFFSTPRSSAPDQTVDRAN